jgi:hypothetical protein
MSLNERRKKIFELVKNSGYMPIEKLVSNFKVTPQTIRFDWYGIMVALPFLLASLIPTTTQGALILLGSKQISEKLLQKLLRTGVQFLFHLEQR